MKASLGMDSRLFSPASAYPARGPDGAASSAPGVAGLKVGLDDAIAQMGEVFWQIAVLE